MCETRSNMYKVKGGLLNRKPKEIRGLDMKIRTYM
jgi:hypothetical protein